MVGDINGGVEVVEVKGVRGYGVDPEVSARVEKVVVVLEMECSGSGDGGDGSSEEDRKCNSGGRRTSSGSRKRCWY